MKVELEIVKPSEHRGTLAVPSMQKFMSFAASMSPIVFVGEEPMVISEVTLDNNIDQGGRYGTMQISAVLIPIDRWGEKYRVHVVCGGGLKDE